MFIKKVFLISVFILFSSQLVAKNNSFEIYDGTQYKNRPNMEQYGIKDITILYGSRFWDKGKSREDIPSNKRLKKLARKYDGKTEMIVLDIEHWKVQGHPLRPWIIDKSIKKYTETIKIFKSHTMQSKVGYFGGPFPISNYRASIADKNSSLYKTWIQDNDKLSKLANHVDAVFPSVYTYNENIAEWEKSFLRKVENIKRFHNGKVYVFLWPQYFDNAPAPEHLRLKFMPANFWKHQLEFANKHVDGVVIWGGWDFKKWQPMVWDDNSDWWIETKKVVTKLQENTQ